MNYFIKTFAAALVLYVPGLFGQTVDFDEFKEMSVKFLKQDKLEAIKEFLPPKFNITALDFGDFTGDKINDFAIAVRPVNRRDKTIFTFLFVDSLDKYIPVLTDTLSFFELPIEIGFSINNTACYITHKNNDRSWTITGFSFLKNEYSLVDYFRTDVYPLAKKYEIGKEDYNNYSDLSACAGYFDLNTLRDYKKNKFFIHPVYDLRRNVYNSYKRSVSINNSWLWDDSLKLLHNYGSIEINKDKEFLVFDFRLTGETIEGLSKNIPSTILICLDRSVDRLSKNNIRRTPVFRDNLNDDNGVILTGFLPGSRTLNIQDMNFGANMNKALAEKIICESDGDNVLRLKIPSALLDLPEGQNEAGMFIKLRLKSRDGKSIELTNSNGIEDDPSSYGRILFLNENEFYGNVKNEKFALLLKKAFRNGIIVKEDRD